MSISLTAVQQTEFDSLVKAEYQSSGFKLKDAMRMRSDVTGSAVDFRKVGQIIANAAAYQQTVTAQDPGYSKATANLQKYMAPVYVDTVQELTVNFDSKMESALLVSDAMGRRCDQISIDAMTADPGTTIANGGTNFSYTKYRQILENFDDNSVPMAERYVAMSANNFSSLLTNQEFTNIDFTSNRVLDNAMAQRYLGFNIIVIPKMLEGGLPKTGNIRTAFAFHKMAIGNAVGHDFRTEINYVAEKASYLVNGIFSMGSIVIDNEGVIAIACDESA